MHGTLLMFLIKSLTVLDPCLVLCSVFIPKPCKFSFLGLLALMNSLLQVSIDLSGSDSRFLLSTLLQTQSSWYSQGCHDPMVLFEYSMRFLFRPGVFDQKLVH